MMNRDKVVWLPPRKRSEKGQRSGAAAAQAISHLILAPMAELSHRALRELIEEFGGCDEYFTEMISAGGLFGGGPFEKWYIDTDPCPEKLVFQLVGSDSAVIAKAAGFLDKLDCLGIDINMGCSAPIIRKSGAGAAWMADIDRAGTLITEVRKAVKKRLSVKLRIGFRDDFEYLVRFCKRLEAEGVEFITLHPRLVTEKFKRTARWEYVSALRKELKIPVAGNGDITTAEDIIRRAEQCDARAAEGGGKIISSRTPTEGRHAVMVGRGAVRMPWIFAEARKEDLTRRHGGTAYNVEEIGLRFLELLAKYQPPEFHVSRAKRFFSYYCDNLKWGNFVKNQINREETLAGIEKAWITLNTELHGLNTD